MSIHTEAVKNWLIGEYSDGGLPDKLIEECRQFHIFTEEDLQFSSYYHIRKFFATDHVDKEDYWRVFNKKYLKTSEKRGKYPDLTLRRGGNSVILVELKQAVGRDVPAGDIIADVEKLTRIGGDRDLIALYTCALSDEEGRERERYIRKETEGVANMGKLHLVRVSVGASFEDIAYLDGFLERHKELGRRSDR